MAGCFFPNSPPGGYIKVPACEPCNHSYHLDEQYVRTALLTEGSFANPAAQAILERLRKEAQAGSLARVRLAARLYNAIEHVEQLSPAGLVLGAAPAVRLEVSRVNRVLEKIVRGLFFHESGRRLDDRAVVYVEIKPDQAVLNRPPFSWVRSRYARPARTMGNVFVYRVCILEDAPDSSIWLLGFYDSILAIAFTALEPPGSGG